MGDETIEWAVRRLSGHLRRRGLLAEAVLDDQPGAPGAQSFEQDRTSGHSTVLFCWEHELDPRDCPAPDPRKPGLPPCRIEPVPMATDTVGELVVALGPRKARGVLEIVNAAETQVIKAARQLDMIYERVTSPLGNPHLPKPAAADGDPGCESCARLNLGTENRPRPWWNIPDYNRGKPTNFGGALPHKMLLCQACAKWALDHDHDVACFDKKGKPRNKIADLPEGETIHLPPVNDQAGECLRKRHDTGFWSGVAGRREAKRPRPEALAS